MDETPGQEWLAAWDLAFLMAEERDLWLASWGLHVKGQIECRRVVSNYFEYLK